MKNERYELVITPHRQTIGSINTKRKTRKKTIKTKQKQIIKKMIFKTKKSSLRNRHKHNTGTSRIKQFHK